MKIFWKVLVAIVVLLVGLALGSLLLPSKWKVERSMVMDAPATVIYPWVSNFKTGWPQWCAFDREDPDIRYSYSGPEEGVGAARSWTSKKMEDGSQSITAANPASGVEFQLKMASTGFVLNGRIGFEPAGNSTKVTWTDWGELGFNPLYKYMALAMDKMMGPTFEKSLAQLKQKAEVPPGKK